MAAEVAMPPAEAAAVPAEVPAPPTYVVVTRKIESGDVVTSHFTGDDFMSTKRQFDSCRFGEVVKALGDGEQLVMIVDGAVKAQYPAEKPAAKAKGKKSKKGRE